MGSNSRANQKLIARYSDQEELGTNLGDLLKAAPGQKGRGNGQPGVISLLGA